MTYLDSSVVIAGLAAEDRRPSDAFWAAPLATSRLTQYEVTVRLQARRAPEAVFRSADALFCNFEWIPLDPVILRRALDPFPKLAVLRTLDALHLATADFLRSRGGEVEIATYDKRLAAGARALGFPLAKL